MPRVPQETGTQRHKTCTCCILKDRWHNYVHKNAPYDLAEVEHSIDQAARSIQQSEKHHVTKIECALYKIAWLRKIEQCSN
jgi:hypothetical protein